MIPLRACDRASKLTPIDVTRAEHYHRRSIEPNARPLATPSETRGSRPRGDANDSPAPDSQAQRGEREKHGGQSSTNPKGRQPPPTSLQQPGRRDQRPRGLRVTRDQTARGLATKSHLHQSIDEGTQTQEQQHQVAQTPAGLDRQSRKQLRRRGRPESRFVRGSLPIDGWIDSVYPPRANRTYVRALK